MSVTPRTKLPANADSINDADDETTRDAFLAVRNVVKCASCEIVGNFILNGRTGD